SCVVMPGGPSRAPRPIGVIAERSEAIHSFFVPRGGLLRFARNDGGYSFAIPRRDAPEVLKVLTLERQRAQGRPAARCTRRLPCKCTQKMRTRAYRFSGNTPAFPAQWLYGLYRALVSAKFAIMCERAALTHRPSLDLIPFVLKGREPVGERGTDPVVFLNPNSCTGFEPEPSKEGSG